MTNPEDLTTPLEWEQAPWRLRMGGVTRNFRLPYLTNSDNPNHVFVGGMGEEEEVTQVVIDHMGKLGISAAGIVLPFGDPDRKIIEATVREAPIAVLQYLNQQAGLPDDAPKHIIGHSQGGAVAIMTAATEPKLYKAIAAIAPAGLTNEALGNTVDKRTRQFYLRLALNALKPDQQLWRSGNLVAGREIGHRILSDLRGNDSRKLGELLRAKVNFAMEQDLTPDVAMLAADHAVRIFAGAEDDLFQAHSTPTVRSWAECPSQ